MNYKYILAVVSAILIFGGVLAGSTYATVGGSSFIYDFKYNPQDESIYYKSFSESGRGCPPELIKLSLVSGGPQVVYSCDDGEKLTQNSGSVSPAVDLLINNITSNFKNLTSDSIIVIIALAVSAA